MSIIFPLQRILFLLLCLLPMMLMAGEPASGRLRHSLDLEQRIACQAAIEDIRWSHRIWPAENPVPKPAREEVLSDAQIRAQVEESLRMEAALKKIYGISIDERMLQAEMNRMARSTRAPHRLRELFQALDNDPVKVADCLARPALVKRLLGEHYSNEFLQQGSAQINAQAAMNTLEAARGRFSDWWQVQRHAFHPVVGGVSFQTLRLPRVVATGSGSSGRAPVAIAADSWKKSNVPSIRLGHTAVWTGSEMIVWGGVPASGGRYDPVTDSWIGMNSTGAPYLPQGHTAIWTGTEMIVWGGNSDGYQDAGGRYDPLTDTWQGMNRNNAPYGREEHTAVWTGSEMIVWGGRYSRTGGRYNPGTDSWQSLNVSGAPSGYVSHSAVWTGREMLVWGGQDEYGESYQDGGRYDPVSDTWQPMNLVRAPDARSLHSAVWTGNEMIVWGGSPDSVTVLDTGGRYDPVTDSWASVSLDDAPAARDRHTTVWTGTEMIVWGGRDNVFAINTGGIYHPSSDTWTPIDTVSAPGARYAHTAVWTGEEMLVWGGDGGDEAGAPLGGRYNPVTNHWTEINSPPVSREGNTAIWTGNEMIVWGGWGDNACSVRGSRYEPATDTWSFMAVLDPWECRLEGSAVWTGKEMIVWGGYDSAFIPVRNGARYDPMLDVWIPVTNVDAPQARYRHSAVWTGQEMIIWGGRGSGGLLDSGARYDPVSDRWQAVSTLDSPSGREWHTALWTGEEMIVWGGRNVSDQQSGARYDPLMDSWRSITDIDAPSAREKHTAVWTGDEMIVWGGQIYSGGDETPVAGGARYSPDRDRWTEMSSINEPVARSGHSATWTGTEMIVWGGIGGASDGLASGGRYSPAANTWQATNEADAPMGRGDHTAIWTGSRMLVWGGTRPGGVSSAVYFYYPYQQSFLDVPYAHWAYWAIETVAEKGMASGYGDGRFGPEKLLTRAEMSIFLEKGMNGATFNPPTATGTVFVDVPAGYWAAAWIEKLYADGITGGCGGGSYCPEVSVDRAAMAVLLLRAEHGSGYAPPAASGALFADVPMSHWAAPWIEQLASEGITSGCGGGNYCPEGLVTRAEMAMFLVRVFNL